MNRKKSLSELTILLWDDCTEHAFASEFIASLLSATELQRYSTMTHAGNSALFLAGRVLLRLALAQQAGCEPAALEIAIGQHGKPFLASPALPLHFNLSHNKQAVALALVGECEVGVDLEDLNRHVDAQALVARFCTPLEQQWFATLPAARQQAAFFTLWSLKEACLKAWGSGIAKGFDRFSVLPDERRIVVHDAQLSAPHTALSAWYTTALPDRILAVAQTMSSHASASPMPPVLYKVMSVCERDAVLQFTPQPVSWTLCQTDGKGDA